MIYNIMKNLFEIKRKKKCITLITNREIPNDFSVIKKSEKIIVEKTCLSKYFSDRKGLNTIERLKFDIKVITAHNQR